MIVAARTPWRSRRTGRTRRRNNEEEAEKDQADVGANDGKEAAKSAKENADLAASPAEVRLASAMSSSTNWANDFGSVFRQLHWVIPKFVLIFS